MNGKLVSCLAAAVLFGGIATAHADVKAETFTLTPFVGGYTFDGDQHLTTRAVYGLRGGYNFTKHFGAEGVFDYVRTFDTRNSDLKADVYNFHLDALYHFLPDNRLVPFVMAGLGGAGVKGRTIDEWRLGFNYGVGVKYALMHGVDLRGEVRHIMYSHEEVMHNVEYGIGLGFVFGGAEPAAAAAPAPAPAPAPVAAPAPPMPSGTLAVTPASAMKGAPATIAWECRDADAADLQPAIGAVPVKGSKEITASDSTNYTLTCSGAGGKATAASALTVMEAPKPSCTMSATPDTITEGQSARLDWECVNADTAEIAPELGKVEPRGSKVIMPGYTATYTVTGSGANATATASTMVKVNPLPPEKRSMELAVHFDTAKSVIKPAYRAELERVAAFLKEYPGVTGTIEGHTDNVGGKKMNEELSQRRAEAVVDYLVKNFGIDRSRLKAVGYGPNKPIASNATAAGRAKNRRTVASFETVVVRMGTQPQQ